MSKFFFVLLFLIIVVGCGDSRPGDLSEGIPGYIVSPENISVSISGNTVSFSAPAGTVQQNNSEMVLAFWTPTEDQVSALQSNASSGSANLSGVSFLGSTSPNDDGSINVSINVENPQAFLAISIGTSSSVETVTLEAASVNQATLVHKSYGESGGFSALFSDS